MLTNGKIKSIFQLSVASQDFSTDITGFKLQSKPLPPERTTFLKYTQGMAVEWTLEVSAVFDGGSAGSLHSFIWDYAGGTAAFIIKPFQEFDPLTKRYFYGSIRLPHRPDIKAKAGEISTFTYEFKVLGHPARGDRPGGFITSGYYDDY